MGTRFYGHYFLQVVPIVALIAAWVSRQPAARASALAALHATPATIWLVAFAAMNAIRMSSCRKNPNTSRPRTSTGS